MNTLGVSEATVQPYGLGDNEILVELPGISDPGKVEDAIKSTSKDMATIVHEITKPTTWIKKAAGTAASIIGKFFGM